jgi:hypothetical protein
LHERTGDRDALLLAAAQRVGALISMAEQAHTLEIGQRPALFLLGENSQRAAQPGLVTQAAG